MSHHARPPNAEHWLPIWALKDKARVYAPTRVGAECTASHRSVCAAAIVPHTIALAARKADVAPALNSHGLAMLHASSATARCCAQADAFCAKLPTCLSVGPSAKTFLYQLVFWAGGGLG